jgi:hypothetical protein
MSDSNFDTGAGLFWLAIALVFIFCWGEPSLKDALIHWLMK